MCFGHTIEWKNYESHSIAEEVTCTAVIKKQPPSHLLFNLPPVSPLHEFLFLPDLSGKLLEHVRIDCDIALPGILCLPKEQLLKLDH